MAAAYGFHVILAFVFGYLLGSIPFGILVTKLGGGVDPRTIGSGNIGATNVLRSGDKKLAALTLLGDALKGTAAVLLGWGIGGEGTALAAAIGAFIGHLFPVWLGFKGGKGVATFLGVALGLQPFGALVFVASGSRWRRSASTRRSRRWSRASRRPPRSGRSDTAAWRR